MGIPDHLTCRLKNLFLHKETTVRQDMEEQTVSKSGKKYVKTAYCHCLFKLYAEYTVRNAGLDEAQAGIMIARRNINNIIYADDTTFTAEREEELKSLLRKMKEESENVGLKLNIRKTKIMASGPITSWQADGETVETVADFIFLAPKSLQIVTAAMKLKDTCSLEGNL